MQVTKHNYAIKLYDSDYCPGLELSKTSYTILENNNVSNLSNDMNRRNDLSEYISLFPVKEQTEYNIPKEMEAPKYNSCGTVVYSDNLDFQSSAIQINAQNNIGSNCSPTRKEKKNNDMIKIKLKCLKNTGILTSRYADTTDLHENVLTEKTDDFYNSGIRNQKQMMFNNLSNFSDTNIRSKTSDYFLDLPNVDKISGNTAAAILERYYRTLNTKLKFNSSKSFAASYISDSTNYVDVKESNNENGPDCNLIKVILKPSSKIPKKPVTENDAIKFFNEIISNTQDYPKEADSPRFMSPAKSLMKPTPLYCKSCLKKMAIGSKPPEGNEKHIYWNEFNVKNYANAKIDEEIQASPFSTYRVKPRTSTRYDQSNYREENQYYVRDASTLTKRSGRYDVRPFRESCVTKYKTKQQKPYEFAEKFKLFKRFDSGYSLSMKDDDLHLPMI